MVRCFGDLDAFVLTSVHSHSGMYLSQKRLPAGDVTTVEALKSSRQ